MSYRDYLVEMKKSDFHQLSHYKEKDREFKQEYIHDGDWSIQSLCYGPKAHIILELDGCNVELKNTIPPAFAFSDFDQNSFQLINKDALQTMIEHYKKMYQSQLAYNVEKIQEEYQRVINSEDFDAKQWLSYKRDKEVQRVNYEVDNLDYIFDVNKLGMSSNESSEPLIHSYSMYDTLINLFYLYRHFDWETSYLLYAGW